MNKNSALENGKKKLKILLDTGAFHVLIGNFIVKFIGLFGSIFVVRLLTKNEYGMLGYIENIFSYGYIFAGLGLNAALLRYGVIIKEDAQRKGMYCWVVKTQGIINICLTGCVILFAVLFSHPSEYTNIEVLLSIYVLSIPFHDLINTNLSYTRSQLLNKRYMYFSVFVSTLAIVARIVGAKINGLEGVVYFKVLSEVLACTIVFFLVYQKHFLKKIRVKISKQLKKEILLFSVNNMVANGIWILFMITDVFLIGRMLNSPNILADYKVAYTLPSNMAIISAAISVYITPYFVKNENNEKWVKDNYFKTIMVTVILVGALTLFMFVFSPQLIHLIYGDDYLNVVPVMRMLLIAHFINSSFKTITASLLAAMGYAKENMIISAFAFFVQVIMAIYVLPRYSILGLAINNIIVYLGMATILLFVFNKKFHVLKKV